MCRGVRVLTNTAASLGINGTKPAYVPPHMRNQQRAASTPAVPTNDGYVSSHCMQCVPFNLSALSGTAGLTPALPLLLAATVVEVEAATAATETSAGAFPAAEAEAEVDGLAVVTIAVGTLEVAGAAQSTASARGGTARTSRASATHAWRRSCTENPTIPPSSIQASTSRSTTTYPWRLPVQECRSLSPPSPTLR